MHNSLNQDTSLGTPCLGSLGVGPTQSLPAASATIRSNPSTQLPPPVAPSASCLPPSHTTQLRRPPAHRAKPHPRALHLQLPGLDCPPAPAAPSHFLQPLSQCLSTPQSSLLRQRAPPLHALPPAGSPFRARGMTWSNNAQVTRPPAGASEGWGAVRKVPGVHQGTEPGPSAAVLSAWQLPAPLWTVTGCSLGLGAGLTHQHEPRWTAAGRLL